MRMYATRVPADAPPGSIGNCRGILRNLDTRQPIRWPIWFDYHDDRQQLCDFEAWMYDEKTCKKLYATGQKAESLRYIGMARLFFIPRAPDFRVKPTSPRELAESLDDARQRLVEPKLRVIGEECEERGCHRLSCFRVSWEQEIEPQRDADGRLHERAVTREAHCYCAYHARLPRFTSRRGVETEVAVEKPDPVKIHYEEVRPQ